jgi:hypothetical protein
MDCLLVAVLINKNCGDYGPHASEKFILVGYEVCATQYASGQPIADEAGDCQRNSIADSLANARESGCHMILLSHWWFTEESLRRPIWAAISQHFAKELSRCL